MKSLNRILLFLLLIPNLGFGQNSALDPIIVELEQSLKIEIPKDYIEFIEPHSNQIFDYYFGIAHWSFLDLTTAKEKTLALRTKEAIGREDFAFAINDDEQVLFFRNEAGQLSNKIFLFDLEMDVIYYAFSLKEFLLKEETEKLVEEIETVGFQKQDLTGIMDCTGCLYTYAVYLNTSEYDENYSKKRNKKALELFFDTAEEGHPKSASEIADYYYFQDETDVDKVIEWREKAIAFGNEDDIYELADFIIDYKLEEIDKAITLLKSLLDNTWFKDRATLKLSRIYMKGTGGKLDYEKGIEYTKKAAEMRGFNAIADLAFYYYKGMGVEKNLEKAHQLLVEANNLSIEKNGSGSWDDFIKVLEKEIERNK